MWFYRIFFSLNSSICFHFEKNTFVQTLAFVSKMFHCVVIGLACVIFISSVTVSQKRGFSNRFCKLDAPSSRKASTLSLLSSDVMQLEGDVGLGLYECSVPIW